MPTLSNPRHERFAQELAKGKSASDAYVAAGYAQCRASASRLLTNANITSRVAELQERGAKRAEITLESLTAELNEALELAKQLGQPSAMVAAIREKAVLTGHRVEKRETINKLDPNAMRDDELAAIASSGGARIAEAPGNKARLN